MTDRWDKNARNRNRARDRKMPLLAYAGIADQVVPDWTPVAVQERVEAIVAGYQAAMADGAARQHATIELYVFKLRTACPDLDLEELNEQFEKRRGATQLEYRCDYWCAQLATHTGRTKLDVFNEVKACMKTAVVSKPAPLPRGRKRWEQKLTEWEELARQALSVTPRTQETP